MRVIVFVLCCCVLFKLLVFREVVYVLERVCWCLSLTTRSTSTFCIHKIKMKLPRTNCCCTMYDVLLLVGFVLVPVHELEI